MWHNKNKIIYFSKHRLYFISNDIFTYKKFNISNNCIYYLVKFFKEVLVEVNVTLNSSNL